MAARFRAAGGRRWLRGYGSTRAGRGLRDGPFGRQERAEAPPVVSMTSHCWRSGRRRLPSWASALWRSPWVLTQAATGSSRCRAAPRIHGL